MINKLITWYLMLKKRLLKKTGFMIILLIIPLLAFGFAYFAESEDGGWLRIALAVQDEEDELAVEMMEKIDGNSDVFDFTVCESEEEAKRKVEGTMADAAWIFMDDMEENLKEIAKGDDRPIVVVYESEENTLLKISREKIFSVLYPYIAYYMYEEYVTNEMLPDEDISEEKLREEYEVIADEDGFIEFQFLDSEQKGIEETNYLTSTIRGLLIAIMLLAGVAATMYYLRDVSNGVFSWLAPKKWIFVSWGNNVAAMSLAGVFVTVALVLTDNYTSFGRETVSMILFILAASVFCSILGSLFKTVNRMCIVLPTVLVVTLVFCPVFFNIHIPLQQILPPYYYLYSINDMSYLAWMILYCTVGYPLSYVLNRKCTF